MDTVAVYDASGEQVRSWRYHHNLEDTHLPELVAIDSFVENLDIPAMEKAIGWMIRRHESLRTFFRVVGGEVKQCVVPYDEKNFSPSRHDLTAIGDQEGLARAVNAVLGEMKAALRKIDDPPLMKCCIFSMGDNRSYICVLIHHIISDEWSASVVYKELSTYYEQFRAGRKISVKPLRLQLRDYASLQRKWLVENGEEIRCYWRGKLSGVMAEYHYEDGGGMMGQGLLQLLINGKTACYNCYFELPLFARLSRVASHCTASIWAVLVASLRLLFYTLTGTEKILIATPVSTRYHPGTEELIGYLGGGSYLLQPIREELPVRALIRESYQEIVEAARNVIYDHEEMGLDEPALRLRCDLFANFVTREIVGRKKLQVESPGEHRPLGGPGYYALTFNVLEYKDGLSCHWKYNQSLYSAERISHMVAMHEAIVQALCRNPGITIKELITSSK